MDNFHIWQSICAFLLSKNKFNAANQNNDQNDRQY